VSGKLVVAKDRKSCDSNKQNKEELTANIALIERGDCMFIEKGRVLQVSPAMSNV
jgi:hypothetical protein